MGCTKNVTSHKSAFGSFFVKLALDLDILRQDAALPLDELQLELVMLTKFFLAASAIFPALCTSTEPLHMEQTVLHDIPSLSVKDGVVTPYGNSSWSFDKKPPINSTSHLIFNTVSSLLLHWPNTRYRNGDVVYSTQSDLY